jgi:rhodanese-related sulfurtransferase
MKMRRFLSNQWQWIFGVGLVLSTPVYAETKVKPSYPSSTDTPRSCAVPSATRRAQKPMPMKPTVFSQLQQGGQFFKRGTQKRQSACYVSAQMAHQQWSDKAAFFIDLRDRQAFQRYRIPGSLNMAAHTLKTKAFLKAKPLILFSEGHSYHALEKLCVNLRDAGFSQVAILEGGLNQWRKQVGNLQGNLLAVRYLDRMTAAQFWLERDYEHWLVVDISLVDDKQWPSSGVLGLSLSNQAENWLKQLTAAVAKHRQSIGVSPYVLIVSARGDSYPKVRAILRGTDLSNVFYLQGGVQAYQRFIREQAAMLGR